MVATAQKQLSTRLRERIRSARLEMATLEEGAGGIQVCARFSDVYDGLVREMWDQAVTEIPGAAGARLSLVATGGWGRREVCPFSDIDFILLTSRKQIATAKQLADKLLYPLWDARIDVGHAIREPAATAKLARKDLATATALLDVRHVVGDRDTTDKLVRATRNAIAPGGNPNEFVNRLVAEKQQRHERFGDSLYLLEPNLKHGIGALRDLSTAIWAARARWSVASIVELIGLGHLSSRQVAVLEGARDFLLKVRSLVQLSARRRTDQLTFEIQEAIAPGLFPNATLPTGDVRPAVAPAVEALMRRYYLHARGVVQVKKRLLEQVMVPARRKPRIARVDASFLTFNGKLALHDPELFADRPSEMVRLFHVARELDLPIYGHTKELIAEKVAVDGTGLMRDDAAARLFLAALVDPRDRRQPSLLEEMHQLGLLNAIVPEFAPCTCRVQHDLYHVYTVDQHQLYAVAMLKRLARGDLAAESPTATAAYAKLDNVAPLYVATLLHDAGKPLGKGHATKGAPLAGAVASRLGLAGDDVAKAEFLVREHLTMSHLSQRRDLGDPEVIKRFASRVGDEETLVQLYLLTLCDTAMTSPGNLSTWKDELLRQLFTRTRDFLRGDASAEQPEPAFAASRVRTRALEMLTEQSPEASGDMERLVGGIDERFFVSLTPRQVARHVRLAHQHETGEFRVELSVAHYPLKGYSEVQVVCDDQPGVLSAIAGVLAANRVDVLSAFVGCRADSSGAGPVALDLFYVRDLVGNAIPVQDARWERIRADLTGLLDAGQVDGAAIEQLIARRRQSSTVLGARVTPAVPTEIRIDNEASADYSIAEVFTENHVGVLYAITHALAGSGLDIHLAKISTEGERAADAFYVTNGQGGGKLVELEQQQQVRSSIAAGLEALGDG